MKTIRYKTPVKVKPQYNYVILSTETIERIQRAIRQNKQDAINSFGVRPIFIDYIGL